MKNPHPPLTDADLALAQARYTGMLFDALFSARPKPAKKIPSPQPRGENTFSFEYEDGIVTFLYDAEVTDWGNEDDAPTCRLLKVIADFGGATQVEVPLSALSGALLNALEQDASDQVTEQEYERERESKQNLRALARDSVAAHRTDREQYFDVP